MIHVVTQSVLQYVNHQNATQVVKSLKQQYVMSNVKSENILIKDQIVLLCAQIKLAKWLTVLNVLMYAKLLIVLLTANHQNRNVNQYVLNLIVIGNVLNHFALNQNVSLFVKILLADLKFYISIILYRN